MEAAVYSLGGVAVRNLAWALTLLIGAVVAFFVLLPVLGIVALIIAAAVLMMLAAPLLQRLPWFRDRIHVERRGGFRTYRFGSSVFMTYDTSEAVDPDPAPEPLAQLDSGDVIDVEGQEISDRDDSERR